MQKIENPRLWVIPCAQVERAGDAANKWAMVGAELGRSRTACRQAWIRHVAKPPASRRDKAGSGEGAGGPRPDGAARQPQWTAEQEAELVAAVKAERANHAPASSSASSSAAGDQAGTAISWVAVAAAVAGRSPDECFSKWRKTNFGAVEDGVQWTEQQREALVAAVSAQDADVWAGESRTVFVGLKAQHLWFAPVGNLRSRLVAFLS